MLCLDRAAVGQSVRLSAARPAGYDIMRALRADMMPGEDDAAPPSSDGPELAASGTGVAVVRTIGCIEQRADAYECGGWTEGYDTLCARFCEAHEAEQAGAVLLVLDGPGGDVAGLEQAALRMLAAATESAKPTLVYVDEMAASAHYWIAAVLGTGGIFLPPSGRVGSIGAMSVHCDNSGANELAGLVVTYFSSPSGKVAGNPDEALSDLATARRQGSVDEAATRFVAAISAARGLSPEAVIALDGAMLTGQAAVDAGLADGLATFEEVVALAAARASAGASLAVTSTPALAPPAPQGTSMAHAFSAALLAHLPTLSASDSPAAIETALLGKLSQASKAGGHLSALLAAAGEQDPEAAVGTIKALRDDAARVPELLMKLKASDAIAAQAAEQAEQAERISLLESAIEAGKYTPHEVWDTDAAGAKSLAAVFGAPGADGVGMSLPALRANVARKSAGILGGKQQKGADDTSAAAALAAASGLTDHERATCAAKGWDPAKFASKKAQITGGGAAKSA